MFIDKVRISVKAGAGGNGAVAFHREKYVASGGPDGGDGGHGGSVVLHVNDNLSTLLDFRYKRKYQASAGVNGMGRKMAGKRGENLVIDVPRGTVVRDAESGQIIVDMSTGEDFVIARGGRGGWGNAHYATPTRQVPPAPSPPRPPMTVMRTLSTNIAFPSMFSAGDTEKRIASLPLGGNIINLRISA